MYPINSSYTCTEFYCHQFRLQSEFFEHIWVDIRVNDKIYSLNTLYRPPNESNESHALFLSESEKILSSMSAHNADNFILAADLNFGNSSYCTYPVLSPKPLDDKAPVLFSSFGLTQLIDNPTRFTDSTRGVTTSLINLIFCKDIDNIESHGTLPCIADHDGVFVLAELQYLHFLVGWEWGEIRNGWDAINKNTHLHCILIKKDLFSKDIFFLGRNRRS